MSTFGLYTYFRSSATYRVRIALHLKKLAYTPHYIHLVKEGGDQHLDTYRAVNPQKLVPALVVEGLLPQQIITQSLAIMEYLDELHPSPPLLPATPLARAQVRAFALAIGCEIQPLNNLRVVGYLKNELRIDEPSRIAWHHHWMAEGFSALEQQLTQQPHTTPFCFGDTPTLADICLIPQFYNAKRLNYDTTLYPTLTKINRHCLTLDLYHGRYSVCR
ncbi:MAG: maleylacetoacetate isomerase [Halothiobacillaceae bacterium]|nr:MAG: maleylacetoacetate isomerase [Halothiobacillaceae bacterium]